MAKVGRPTKYKPEYAEQVFKLCLLGATDERLADFFGVAVSTIYEWTNGEAEFSEARRKGKEWADANVAEALYNRALGYSHPEEKIFQSDGDIIRANTTKHYPPDTAAAFIWLKNRAGWRDKQEVDVTSGGEPLYKSYQGVDPDKV
jgi:transcriptional regulator with XRE-family HTH domain